MRLLPKSFEKHWSNPKNLMQVLIGPRQVGKTTAVTERLNKESSVYASADLPIPPTPDFIIEHWKKARSLGKKNTTLVLDEIQKIPRWSETVKALWDEDVREKKILNVWILGSSAVLIEKGLSESLTGRFEVNPFPHWIFAECKEFFHITIDEYAKWGGYPRVYSLREDLERTLDYIQNSILEPSLGRDVLALHAVDKPALLRQLFWYVSKLPSQIVSYEKILGHLQGKGNSATLVHYAELLQSAFLLMTLPKHSGKAHQTKRSRPKWIIPNPALVDPSISEQGLSGFVFENLVGSHLVNLCYVERRYGVQYWREGNQEIDFVLTDRGKALLLFEAKSGKVKKLPSTDTLVNAGLPKQICVITKDNIADFSSTTSISEVVSFAKNLG